MDDNRVLLDGPLTGVAREVYPIKRISLTDIRVDVHKGARSGVIRKAWEKDNVTDKFNATSWGKKLNAQKKRASLNDFERFQAMILKKRLNFAIRHPNGAAKKGKK